MNQKNRRPFIVVLTISLALFLSTGYFIQISKAFSSGVSGFSGASGGVNCNQCHTGGTEPIVTLSGPTSVLAGDELVYTLTVAGGQEVAAGLDVAVTDGTLITLANSLYTKIANGEVTHHNSDPTQKASPNYPSYGHDGGPKCIADDCTQVPGGEVVFSFGWTAPETAVSVTMFGAGNSVDLSGNNTGDRAGTDTLTITVIDPATLTEKLYLPIVATN